MYVLIWNKEPLDGNDWNNNISANEHVRQPKWWDEFRKLITTLGIITLGWSCGEGAPKLIRPCIICDSPVHQVHSPAHSHVKQPPLRPAIGRLARRLAWRSLWKHYVCILVSILCVWLTIIWIRYAYKLFSLKNMLSSAYMRTRGVYEPVDRWLADVMLFGAMEIIIIIKITKKLKVIWETKNMFYRCDEERMIKM